MSWLLVGIGGLVSLFTAIKAYHSDDPYPGYSNVQKTVDTAHEDYTVRFEDAIIELDDLRSEAIDDLREAGLVVHSSVSGAIDALYGQASMRAHLAVFLDQCNSKANLLLTQYRDANRVSRNDPVPSYFDHVYAFSPFKEASLDRLAKVDAERKKQELESFVDQAIVAVGVEYMKALQSIKEIETLEALAPIKKHDNSIPDVNAVEAAGPPSDVGFESLVTSDEGAAHG